MEPDNVFAGCGIWHPDTQTLSQVRDAIVENPERWQGILASDSFRANFELEGDSLKRAPKGYDPAHPLINDLRRKDFVAGKALTEADACAPDFMDRYAATCRAAAPFAEFLTGAVGLPW